jgi:hypothetical protein
MTIYPPIIATIVIRSSNIALNHRGEAFAACQYAIDKIRSSIEFILDPLKLILSSIERSSSAKLALEVDRHIFTPNIHNPDISV